MGNSFVTAIPGAGMVRALSPFSAVGKAFAPVLRSIVDVPVRVIHKEMGVGSIDRRKLWLLALQRKSDCSQLTAPMADG